MKNYLGVATQDIRGHMSEQCFACFQETPEDFLFRFMTMDTLLYARDKTTVQHQRKQRQ